MELDKNGNPLIEIDYNLIRDLRRQGKWYEADQLLNGFRTNMKDNKKQMSLEIDRVDAKVMRIHKRKEGICYICSRPVKEGTKSFCEYHIEKRSEAQKKWRESKKNGVDNGNNSRGIKETV